MSERKPLTLEELRDMDGKPVLFVSLKDGRKKWRVVQSIEKFVEVVKVICFTDDGGETVESYGKTWLAYADEPPRLDRSAWEPCEWCGEWIGFDCRPKEQDVGYRLYAGFCKQVAADDFWEDETENLNFCPICGRPLTDAAWEMLEKRVEEIT